MGVGKTNRFPAIEAAIEAAEAKTRAEIHVHLSRRWWDNDPMASARAVFDRYGLASTLESNAVLVYLNLRARRFAIIADAGIDAQWTAERWKTLGERVEASIRRHGVDAGVAEAIRDLGEELARLYPHEGARADTNELPNTVTED